MRFADKGKRILPVGSVRCDSRSTILFRILIRYPRHGKLCLSHRQAQKENSRNYRGNGGRVARGGINVSCLSTRVKLFPPLIVSTRFDSLSLSLPSLSNTKLTVVLSLRRLKNSSKTFTFPDFSLPELSSDRSRARNFSRTCFAACR